MKSTTRNENKEKTYDLLIASASSLIKTRGFIKLSIEEVMAKANLTRGSFYVYFKNKAQLISKAFSYSVEESNKNIKSHLDKIDSDPDDCLNDFLEFYLSSFHSKNTDIGCPIAALSRDFSLANKNQRDDYSRMLSGLFESRRRLLKSSGKVIDRDKWIAITASYVGAITLSRASSGTDLSEEILESTKKFLKQELK